MVEEEEKHALTIPETMNEGNKRKLEDEIQLAKKKAQEIAARLRSNADPKRPRLLDDNNLSKPALFSSFIPPLSGQFHSSQGTSKIITIPNGKVGVVIGKGGETIKYLQLQSGVNIQITKDSDADPYSQTRGVELTGTMDQISRAEQLIDDVINETDGGGSAPSASMQPGAEQFIMKVPNDKVASLIGKGGETIRSIQSSTGARIQIIPLRLPPGDTSRERSVYINGLKEQIDSAKELIDERVSGNRLRNLSGTSSYVQPVYPPPGNWGPPGQPPMQQQPGYWYPQPGPCVAPTPYCGGYPAQVPGSDQSNPSDVPPPPQQSSGYNYYGQQAQMGSAPPNFSYSYSYSQTLPVTSQSYDHSFSQQPPSFRQDVSSQAPPLDQQKPYLPPGYGPTTASFQPDGITPNQSTQQSFTYQLGYNQPMDTAQAGYGTAPTYMGPPPALPGHDQMGFTQSGYGGQQPIQVSPLASHPVYEQGYPPQPAFAPANCAPGTIPPAYEHPQLLSQPQSEPTSDGFSQPLIYGAEESGARKSAPVLPETVRSES
uniref:Putative far upstream element-binding protein 1-like n=1 Tax=Davidia involucrata TaxID=16924 RepID=A0A5B7C385_DAVIN